MSINDINRSNLGPLITVPFQRYEHGTFFGWGLAKTGRICIASNCSMEELNLVIKTTLDPADRYDIGVHVYFGRWARFKSILLGLLDCFFLFQLLKECCFDDMLPESTRLLDSTGTVEEVLVNRHGYVRIYWPRYPRGMHDIGIFDNRTLSPCAVYLTGSKNVHLPEPSEIHSLVENLGGNPEATFTFIDKSETMHMTADVLGSLRAHIDAIYMASVSNDKKPVADLKIRLSRNKLQDIIGNNATEELTTIFGLQNVDNIIIRRCCAYNKFISFHIDNSAMVMQVALNELSEYCGGQLVYASCSKLIVPDRPAGAITIHSRDIVHGVTKLISGVRYSLFLIKK